MKLLKKNTIFSSLESEYCLNPQINTYSYNTITGMHP